MSKEELLKYLIAEIDLIMHDKDYRFENANGTWYSRESCRDLTNEEMFEELRTELRQFDDLEAKLAESEKQIKDAREAGNVAVDSWCKNRRKYEAQIAEMQNKSFILYSMLYETLEKQGCDNVASQIDQMTGWTYDKETDWLKGNRNYDQLKQQLAESETQLKEELEEKNGVKRALSACNRQNDEFADMIKKLENENEELKQQLEDSKEKLKEYATEITRRNTEQLDMQTESFLKIRDLETEILILKQQLHDLPKKIVEEIKGKLHDRLSKIAGYGRMTSDEFSFFVENEFTKDIDTILEMFGGEDE